MTGQHHVEQLDGEGHRVRVGPGDPQAADVLEYAALLIETEGWNNLSVSGMESSKNQGWSLHDAIGESCRRLSANTAIGGSRGSKDAAYTSYQGGGGQSVSVSLRTGAQEAVDNELRRMAEAGEWTPPAGGDLTDRPDYTYNDDTARTPDDVLGVLRRAREAVSANG